MMKSKEFPHPKKPCFCIFWLSKLTINGRRLEFLEILEQIPLLIPPIGMLSVMRMMSPERKTRIKSTSVIPPIRCIQGYATLNYIVLVYPLSFMRPTYIHIVSILFLSITDPYLSLLLQTWKPLEDDFINVNLLLLSSGKPFLFLNK